MYKVILRDSILGEHTVIYPPDGIDDINITYSENETYKTVSSKYAIGLSFYGDALTFIDTIWKRDDYLCEIEIDIYNLNAMTKKYSMIYSGMIDSKSISRGINNSKFDIVQGKFERSIYDNDTKVIDYDRITDINGNEIVTDYTILSDIKLTSLPNTTAEYISKAVSPFNLFRKMVYVLTGTTNFRSHFFNMLDDVNNLNGGRFAFLTNGKYLRGQNDNGSISTTFSDLFTNYCKIFGLGMQVEFDDDGTKWVRIDKLEWFHNPQIIADFEHIDNLEITLNEAYLYGSVKVGYSASNNTSNEYTGAEYNVSSAYNLSKGYNSNELDLVSNFRADGTAIKLAIDINVENTGEGEYDNELFIVMCKHSGFVYTQNTDSIQVSGISGNQYYCNMEISPARIFDNNNLIIQIPTVKRSMKFIYSSAKRLSKLSTILIGETTTTNDCVDINTDRYTKSYLSPYIAKFTALITKEMIRNVERNPNGLCRFIDEKTKDVLFGRILELSLNPNMSDTNVTLQLVYGNYDNISLICDDNFGLWQWDDGAFITI